MNNWLAASLVSPGDFHVCYSLVFNHSMEYRIRIEKRGEGQREVWGGEKRRAGNKGVYKDDVV